MTGSYDDTSFERCSLSSCENPATHSVKVGTRRTPLCGLHASMLEMLLNAQPRCPQAVPLLESAKADLQKALTLDPSLSDAKKFLADVGSLLERCR